MHLKKELNVELGMQMEYGQHTQSLITEVCQK